MSFDSEHELFKPLNQYIAANSVHEGKSFSYDVLAKKKRLNGSDNADDLIKNNVSIGVGKHCFRAFDGSILYTMYQQVGKPVGTRSQALIYQSLVIFTNEAGELSQLTSFLSTLVDMIEKDEEKGMFKCYTWNIRRRRWQREDNVLARPLQSVVVPQAMKDRLVNDIEKFLKPSTRDFYFRHGIPYRRSYLFYGIPGVC